MVLLLLLIVPKTTFETQSSLAVVVVVVEQYVGVPDAGVMPALAVNVLLLPTQIVAGEADAVTVGLLTTATAVVAVLEHPAAVTVTVYVPVAANVAPVILGFCVLAVKVFGPAQAKVVPMSVVAVKFKLVPAQTGLLLPAVATGTAFTVTAWLAVAVQPDALVTVTV